MCDTMSRLLATEVGKRPALGTFFRLRLKRWGAQSPPKGLPEFSEVSSKGLSLGSRLTLGFFDLAFCGLGGFGARIGENIKYIHGNNKCTPHTISSATKSSCYRP